MSLKRDGNFTEKIMIVLHCQGETAQTLQTDTITMRNETIIFISR